MLKLICKKYGLFLLFCLLALIARAEEGAPFVIVKDGKFYLQGKEYRYVIEPGKFGITEADENELEGGSGADNAKLAMEVLQGGGRKSIRAAVGLNAGAVLYLSGKAKTLKDGYDMALAALSSGMTLKKLQEIQKVSEELVA